MTAGEKDFYFISELLGRRVVAPDGRAIGRAADVIVERVEPYPLVVGLAVRRRFSRATAVLPWSCVSAMIPAAGNPWSGPRTVNGRRPGSWAHAPDTAASTARHASVMPRQAASGVLTATSR